METSNGPGADATPADSARRIKDSASTVLERGKEAPAAKEEKGAEQARSTADSAASALRRAADDVESDNHWIGSALRKSAEGIERASRSLDGGDLSRALDDLNGFARRNPWTEFTDLGMTMLDDQGRQLGKSPLNYAFGRLHVDLTDRTGGPREAELALFPGFADPAGVRTWSATVSIRLYADSAHVTRTRAEAVTVPAGGSATVSVPFPESRLLLGTAFVPLGIVVVPEDDQTWTLEVSLPAPGAPLNP